ncbi:unnamed protein product [Closterium sp. NIES-54]
MENLMYKDWKAENEAKIGMRFGEVKSSGLEHVELPLELSSSSTTTRQSSLVNGGEEAKDAEEEEEEVQQQSVADSYSPILSLSPQQLREWFVRHTRLRRGASGAGGANAAGGGGTGVAAGAGDTGGTATAGSGGARTRGAGAAGTSCIEGAGAGDLHCLLLLLTLSSPAVLHCVVPDPESDRARAASPTVSRLLATTVTDPSFESAAASALDAELLDFAAACRLDYATALVAESASASPPSIGGECALGTDVLEDRQEDFESLAAVVPPFASMLLALEGDLDAPDC